MVMGIVRCDCDLLSDIPICQYIYIYIYPFISLYISLYVLYTNGYIYIYIYQIQPKHIPNTCKQQRITIPNKAPWVKLGNTFPQLSPNLSRSIWISNASQRQWLDVNSWDLHWSTNCCRLLNLGSISVPFVAAGFHRCSISELRFHRDSIRVPSRFHRGSIEVPSGSHIGYIGVPSGFHRDSIGVASGSIGV